MAGMLPLAATLCFRGFSDTVQSTFSDIHYVQIIHNDSIKHTCEDDFLKQIEHESSIPVLLTTDLETVESKKTFIIFYSDKEDDENLQLIVSKDLEKFPDYSNVLIVHSNMTFQQHRSQEIIEKALKSLILNVAILYTKNSTASLAKNVQHTWLPTMRNQTIRIGVFHYEPMVYYSPEKGIYDGLEKYILDEIIKDWNITYVNHSANSWHKLNTDVNQGIIDMALCGFWSETLNATTADMSRYYTQVCNTFVVPKAKIVPLSFTYILRSFQYTLYILLLTTIILVSAVTKLLKKDNRSYLYHFLEVYKVTINMSIRIPKIDSIRVILGIWLLCAILINVFHSAGLTRKLFSPRYANAVLTFADMHKQNVKWLLRSPNIIPLINASHDYYKKNLITLLVGSHTQGADEQNIDFSKYAAPANVINGYVDIPIDRFETMATHAHPLSECLSNSYFVFPMKKQSPIKRIIDKKLIQITESGLVQAWMNQLEYKNYKALRLTPLFHQTYPYLSQLRPLTMKHLQGAFLILVGGFFMGILIWITERVF